MDITFAHVGRVISHWESIEFELSRLYAWFSGAPEDQGFMEQYGTGTIFQSRANNLAKRADALFTSSPDQRREGEFGALLTEARGFSNRRSDIAHGIIFPIDRLTFFRSHIKRSLLHRKHYAIIPPIYAGRYANAQGFPEFAYTSVEMSRLTNRLRSLQAQIVRYHQGR